MDKKSKAQHLFLTLFLLSLSFTTPAEGLKPGYWSVQLENDAFTRSGDRYYTHGTQVSYLTYAEPDYWLVDIARRFPMYQLREEDLAVNHTLGQKIFTPDDTDSSDLIEDDRPYAGYLYYDASLLSHTHHGDELEAANILGLTVGVVGPSSRAEQLNNWYHNLADLDRSNGWDNQLADEPALGVTYTRLWSIVTPEASYFEFGAAPHFTVKLSNVYTYIAGGVMFRFGSNLRGELSPPTISPGFPGASFFDIKDKYNWYFFAGHESRLVERNIFLDGNTFKDGHSVEKERLVGDYQFGFAVHINKIRVSLSHMIRTKEYTTQEDQTEYGAINVSFYMD